MSSNAFRQEQSETLTQNVKFIAAFVSWPLFLIFMVADWLRMPDVLWECFLVRIWILPICLATYLLLRTNLNFSARQIVSLLFTLGNALLISILIDLDGGYESPYFGGIILVIISSVTFMPFQKRFTFLNIAMLLSLYNIFCWQDDMSRLQISEAVTKNFFLIGSSLLSSVTRYFFHQYQFDSFQQNLRMLSQNRELEEANRRYWVANEDLIKKTEQLRTELIERETIIRETTTRNLELSFLESHFSPQVIDLIKSKPIKNKQERAKVCVMFVDIVNSTFHQQKVSTEDFSKIISEFIDAVTNILKRHNITMDKFLGDGILAYSGHPLSHAGYAESICDAALDISQHYERIRPQLRGRWGGNFEIRIGIEIGEVMVGSFGSTHQHYTLIGKAVNRAQRACASAKPSQILISHTLRTHIDPEMFILKNAGLVSFKGLKDPVELFEINGKHILVRGIDESCPDCGAPLVITKNDFGIAIQKCSECGYEES